MARLEEVNREGVERSDLKAAASEAVIRTELI